MKQTTTTTTLSLTGGNKYNLLNLTGKGVDCQRNIPEDIKKIKILILNQLLMPLISKQWDILNENLICLERAKRKINYYYDMYKMDDLIIYKEIIRAFEYMISEHRQLEDLEKKMYGGGSEDVTTMIYKTTLIRLKPEYEIYDMILGRPDRTKNEKYNDLIIKEIAKLLTYDSMHFNKIRDIIRGKYG